MKPQLVHISEEIVRWSFEISVNESEDWFITFTNPTAGPWKRITAPNENGKFGEIHRFEIDETRPDLILVNDISREVVIIEAKTSFSDLQKPAQIAKTSQLFLDLRDKLRNVKSNEFWGNRSQYTYSLGLLWSSGDEASEEIVGTCKAYLQNILSVTDDIICIRGTLSGDVLSSSSFKAISGKVIQMPN